MAITFVAVGATAQNSSGDVTPALPSGWATDDILIVTVSAHDNIVCSFPSGWAILNATNNGTTYRFTVAWKRAVSSEADPVVTHTAGAKITAVVSAWRGATGAGTTNSPFSVVGTPSANAASATVTANGITPDNGHHVMFIGGVDQVNLQTESLTSDNCGNPTLAARFFVSFASNPVSWIDSAVTTTGTATTVNTCTVSNAAVNVGQLVSMIPAGFTFIASAGAHAETTGTTLDCTAALNVAAGDLLVVFMSQEAASNTYSCAATTGAANSFTFDAADENVAAGPSITGTWGYKLSATANATATFRGTWGTTETNRRIIVMQFRPLAGATVTKDGSNKGSAVGTAATSGNITTTGTDEVACGYNRLFNAGFSTAKQINAVAGTEPSASPQAAGTADPAEAWYRILAATFTGGQANCTEAISDTWICGIIAFKSVAAVLTQGAIYLAADIASKYVGPAVQRFLFRSPRLPWSDLAPITDTNFIQPSYGINTKVGPAVKHIRPKPTYFWGALLGPQTYVQALTAGLSFVGSLTKATSRQITGGLSFVGAFTKLTLTARTGGLSFSGVFSKQTNKALAGGLSFVGALSKFVSKGLTASLSFVGALTKFTSRSLTGSLSFSGAFAKTIAKAFTATLSFSGAISRLIGKSLTASLSFSGALSKFISKGMTAALSFVGGLTKLTIKGTFTASLSFIGTFATVLLKVVSFTASLSFSGAFSKRTNKSVTGGLSFVGGLTKLTSKGLSGALSFVGGLTKLTSTVRTAALSFIGGIAKQTSRSLTGALSFSGAVTKLTNKLLSGGLSFSGLLTTVLNAGGHLYTQALTASLSFSGSVAKLTKRGFTASLGLAGTGIGPTIAVVSGRIAKRLKGIIYEDIDS